MALFTRVAAPLGFCKNLILNGTQARGFKRYLAPTILVLNSRKKRIEHLNPGPKVQAKRSEFIEWNYNAEIYSFGKRLGEDFKIEILLQAFVHRSYIIQEELKQQEVGIDSPELILKDNDLLNQKGHDLISKQVIRFLSASLPRLPLECVQAIHNYLLSDETLAYISTHLGTKDIILTSEHPPEVTTLARTLKAIVGALAESQSTEVANKFIVDFILTHLAERDLNELYDIKDPFQVVADILSRDGLESPEPRIIGQSATNDILASYIVGLYSNAQLIGSGFGETVPVAVEMAARDSLKRWFNTSDSSAPLRFNETFSDRQPSNLKLAAWKASAFS